MWRPTASLEVLQQRAQLLTAIRNFFAGNALEADVPCLGNAGVTDVHIENIPAQVNGHSAYLQSSPEYFLKRLLAAGSGDLYYLGKVFRDGETGRRHNPEFTLLEWYRRDRDEQYLMEEVVQLTAQLFPEQTLPVNRFHYGQIFTRATGLDPHRTELSELRRLAGAVTGIAFDNEPRATCLDAIFSFKVEPTLPAGLTLIDHYPACQCALAQLGTDEAGNTVALRFEAFLNGMELANGYCESTSAEDLRRRFGQDNQQRQQSGKPQRPIDEKFLAAMAHGLPPCAGVALGVDRLLMQRLAVDCIGDVLPFTFDCT